MPRLPRYRPVGKRVTYLCRLGKLSAGKPAMKLADKRELLRLTQAASKFYGFELLAYKITPDSMACVLHHDGKKSSRTHAIGRIADYYGDEAAERVIAAKDDKATVGYLQRAFEYYGDLSSCIKRVKGGFSAHYSVRHPDTPPTQLWRDRYRAEVVQDKPELILAACAEVEKHPGTGREHAPSGNRFCSFGSAVAGDSERRRVICTLTGKRSWPRARTVYQSNIDLAEPPGSRRHGRKGVFGAISLEKLVETRANQPRREGPKPHSRLTPQSEHLAALRAFKKRFGHTRVPLAWEEDPKLAIWVHARRRLKRQGKLSPKLIKTLDALGFDWVLPRGRNAPFDKISARLQPELYVADAAWVKKLEELKTFIKRHGHAEVSNQSDLPLYRWIYNQRRRWRAGKLSADKEKLLKKAGLSQS